MTNASDDAHFLCKIQANDEFPCKGMHVVVLFVIVVVFFFFVFEWQARLAKLKADRKKKKKNKKEEAIKHWLMAILVDYVCNFCECLQAFAFMVCKN